MKQIAILLTVILLGACNKADKASDAAAAQINQIKDKAVERADKVKDNMNKTGKQIEENDE
ncbi:hypothetical protein [Wielerella bovis]|uniref:hypothetical protein n=1 Tax=Wielerella bovis TaxID=2917790 RepID=UPI002019B2C0|nr:hypothetical protein [Wielerella bovis]ULJ60768.1 hypothetical protein MIS44_02590 [Wielerella bovis]ULJ62955.1 hypothetical protein MIS46_02515 [Wielerella bovis]ULJ65186.1 hypothetical protein MIS33_02575 [Wielerella bovis]ULJ67459.1 hypothetical protein MIS31_02580 [Wielerella bovis]